MIASYWVYVPVHELLHAAGCVGTGGTVTALQIQARYGGALLAKVFPFVTTGGDYAGRLTGFDTHHSDLGYAATIFCPYLLTLMVGPLLRAAARRKNVIAFAACLPAFWAPVTSITGDYFELGSLLLCRLWPGSRDAHRELISDDLFRLLGEIGQRGGTDGVYPFVAASLLLSIVLACGTVALADRIGAAWPWTRANMSR
jgi:hypothetical protein